MRCTRCKKKLKKGAKFCPACGTRVPPKKGKRIVAFLLAVLLLLSLSTIGLAIYVFVSENFSLKQGQSKIYTAQSTVKIANVEEAIAHAKELGKEFGYENAMSEMTEKVITEIDGDCYYRLQQNYKGIPVYGNTLIYATDKDNQVTTISGNVIDVDDSINMMPSISEGEAAFSIQDYLNQYSSYNVDIADISLNSDDLCIYTDKESGVESLAYVVSSDIYEFVIDAHNGSVLYAESTIRTSTYSGTLIGQKKTYPNVSYSLDEGNYYLSDEDKQIYSYRVQNTWAIGSVTSVLTQLWDSQNLIEWTPGGNPEADAVDAYVNTIVAYDYFDQILNNKGADGSGKLPICIFNGVKSYKTKNGIDNIVRNAMANIRYDKEGNPSLACIYIGAGGNPILSAYLDVVAHEYTHNVEKMHSGMRYNGESGALMEALSDIFGELIQSSKSGSVPDWIIESSRNIASPEETNNPSSYGDGNWIDKVLDFFDNDGVHRNSTVVSHAAYLMWNGIDGNSAKKIKSNDLAKLWYRAMLMMPSDCDFATCRQLVEWAALSVDGITEAQRNCIAEAFDMVGIHAQELSPEILINCDRNVRPGSYLNVYNVEGKLHSSYTLSISGTCAEHELAYAPTVLTDIGFQYKKTVEITNASSYRLDLPDGYYTFTITDSNNPKYTYTFTVSVSDQGTTDFIELHTDFENQLIVKIAKPPVSDTYKAYMTAVRKTTESGAWSERLDLTANMALTNGSAKTKTKMTMTSDADISNYSEGDSSRVRISGAAELSVLGQTYAWNMRYENGTAHYQYTQPNQTSADLKIDPSFFNFETMTSDMMTKAKMSGNQITFTVPGDKITEVGIAAVNQMSDVDDLKYGDVDVIVAISSEGTIDTITMAFHASLNYQGYDADVDCNIVYRFSQSAVVSNMPSVTIVPCSYTGQESKFDILTVHEVNGNQIVFTAWWYRIWDISHATATLDGNIASFDYTDANNPNIRAKGTIEFTGSKAILTISECSVSEVHKGSYCFNFLAEALTEQQLMEVGHFLGVPDGLDVTYKQGTPYYWEGVGIYCTEVGIYYHGELVAAADVNSLNGGVAGGILMYSGAAS